MLKLLFVQFPDGELREALSLGSYNGDGLLRARQFMEWGTITFSNSNTEIMPF